MQIGDKVLDSRLVERPIGDIPSLLPILLSVIGDEILVVEAIEDIAHLMDVLVYLLRDFEVRDVLLVF